jgi:ribosomal protein S27E
VIDRHLKFRCPKCRKTQSRGVYALAHYFVDLIGPCQHCGVKLLLPANFGKAVLLDRQRGK